jgi:hypothetical protein
MRATTSTVPFRRSFLMFLLIGATLSGGAAAQAPPPIPPAEGPPPEPVVEKVEEGVYRVDRIQVDQTSRTVSVKGVVNEATVLEFLANAKEGFKAYESALELDTTAEAFNVAMIMIGLEQEHGSPSRYKFDPEAPAGDPVEVWVEWIHPKGPGRIRAEELVWDSQGEVTLPESHWVYTGSVFLEDGSYLAGLSGVLIGFMHTPESIIDSPLPLSASYGSHQINPALGLLPGTPVTVIVKALESSEVAPEPTEAAEPTED